MAENDDNTKEFPLSGVILCCTSIPPENRSILAATAAQMGALHKLDLTSDVTHLIVGDIDTPKYKFVARERPDVKCLLPSWIDAVRQSWLDGGETKVEALESEHRVPTLFGLRICVTGFEDLAYRKLLEDIVNDNGGEYRGNLTKDVTHLIARAPSGNKYSFACEWKIKVVSAEWLTQSLERGMVLEENLFNLLLPESERGQNAWVRKTVSSVSLGKRARDEDAKVLQSRKLRRTASAKLSSQNVGLWSDIVNREIKSENDKGNEWNDQEKGNVNSDGIAQAKADIPMQTPLVNKSPIQPTERFSKVHGESGHTKRWRDDILFRGKSFYLHGFSAKQNSILRGHLTSHCAEIVSDMEELSSRVRSLNSNGVYLLVSHSIVACDIPELSTESGQPTVVTDLWIERCLHHRELINPKTDCTSTPFQKYPLSGFEKLVVCSTAFKGVDLLHLSKTVKLMGAVYNEFLESNVSVLICNSHMPGPEKLRYAIRYKIPIVRADWLWDSVRGGILKPFDPYIIRPPCTESHDPDSEMLDKVPKDDCLMIGSRNSAVESNKPANSRSLVGLIPDISMNKLLTHQDKLKIVPQDENAEEKSITDQLAISNDETEKVNLSQAPGAPAKPLQEISFNSSPSKPTVPSPLKPVMRPKHDDDDSLGPTISSLLAHRQRSSASFAQIPTSDTSKSGRRRRQLLGRAPSGISARSNGSINISRASSVDTANTDGLGTPLEASSSLVGNASSGTLAALWASSDQQQHAVGEAVDDHLQMTQLGYEDPDVRLWRNRVVEKLGGVMEIEPDRAKEGEKRAKSIGVVKDVGKSSGVAKRTRLALGK